MYNEAHPKGSDHEQAGPSEKDRRHPAQLGHACPGAPQASPLPDAEGAIESPHRPLAFRGSDATVAKGVQKRGRLVGPRGVRRLLEVFGFCFPSLLEEESS